MKTKNAFSLIEILVVILIVGLLLVILIPNINVSVDKSKEAGVKSKFEEFSIAAKSMLMEYSGTNKLRTSNVEDTTRNIATALNGYLDDANKLDIDTVSGRYINSRCTDPWNNPYVVHIDGNTITFISYGNNQMTVHAEWEVFDYIFEKCKYSCKNTYYEGSTYQVTEGFDKNVDETENIMLNNATEDCFRWYGTTITGFSNTCGHAYSEHADIIIPEKCTAIGGRAFQNFKHVKRLIIPGTVETIGESAFYGTRIRSLKIEDGVKSIASVAFRNSGITGNLVIPSSVQSVGQSAFDKTRYLESIKFLGVNTYIGSYQFGGCSSLKTIYVPQGMQIYYNLLASNGAKIVRY